MNSSVFVLVPTALSISLTDEKYSLLLLPHFRFSFHFVSFIPYCVPCFDHLQNLQLEDFLIANRDEYLRHSAMNYTSQQRQYNNRLTERLLELAARHGYVFDEEDFGEYKGICVPNLRYPVQPSS